MEYRSKGGVYGPSRSKNLEFFRILGTVTSPYSLCRPPAKKWRAAVFCYWVEALVLVSWDSLLIKKEMLCSTPFVLFVCSDSLQWPFGFGHTSQSGFIPFLIFCLGGAGKQMAATIRLGLIRSRHCHRHVSFVGERFKRARNSGDIDRVRKGYCIAGHGASPQRI